MKTNKPLIEHLYVHLPFFQVGHFYDNQWTITVDNEENINKFLVNLTQELNTINEKYEINLKTLYIGGDIASALTISKLSTLLQLFLPYITNIEEYSFECSFPSINIEKIKVLKHFKINRLIWKVITFQEVLAKKISYNFNYHDSITIITNAINLGFINFSLDLKYNLKHQTIQNLENDLLICLKLQAPHVSYENSNETINSEFKTKINNFLASNNYDNYEYYSYCVSSQFQSQQTIAYCLLKNYCGIGLAAISYIKSYNQTLVIKNSQSLVWIQDITILTEKEISEYQIIQGLLLRKGIALNQTTNKTIILLQPIINKLINQRKLMIQNNQLFCTNYGWALLNELLIDIITSNNN